jgi:signal transduction histidine kinase
MNLTLRLRIFLTLLPLLVLIVVLGTAGMILLSRLGGGIGAILHDNYRSVLFMERLNEALERIDSAFTFALVPGHEGKAREQYDASWTTYREWLGKEQGNITEPGEGPLVDRLTKVTGRYADLGKDFFDRPSGDPRREKDYFGPGGLQDTFKEMKDLSGQILRVNQESMEHASGRAKQVAENSQAWFAVGLAAALLLAGLSAWHTLRTILRPVKAVKEAALGISAGDLNQVVPYAHQDELGELADAFNTMARHLRDYRLSQSARLVRAQRTSQATIDSFPDPVVVLDSEGSVEMANPAARRLLGISAGVRGQGSGIRKVGVGSAFPDPSAARPLTPVVWPEALREPIDLALRGQRDYLPESFDRAILLPGQGGRDQALLPRILTIRDPYGNLLGAAVLLQDVTRLRLLDQVKSNLLATASHELKTPLTGIRLVVHLLLEETIGPLTPKQTELLLDARDNCERLLATVNNLLDLARLEQGRRQLDVRPEAPAALLESAAEGIRPRALDKGVKVVVEVPEGLPPVAADAARLGNALSNLLDNALTYTDPGGRITLSASATPDGVVLSVADTGIGIPAEHLTHVFEKFFRVPGLSRGSGTGLGLAIVNEIVAAHGGAVRCESEPRVGTTFRITLPSVPQSEAVS